MSKTNISSGTLMAKTNIAPASGGSLTAIKQGGVTIVTNPTSINFTAAPVVDAGGGQADVGASSSLFETQEVFTATAGQTVFTLSSSPTQILEFFVNGVNYIEGINFTVLGSNVTWLNTPFIMALGDTVEISYLA